MKSPFAKFFLSFTVLIAIAGCGSSVTPVKSTEKNDAGAGIVGNKPPKGVGIDGDTNGDGKVDKRDVVGMTTNTPWSDARIAAGANHSCALSAANEIRCWGLNTSNQLGLDEDLNITIGHRRPTLVPTPAQAAMIVAAGNTTCVLDSARAVWCWGANESGQVGNGNTSTQKVPFQVSALGRGVKGLALGIAHACAIDSSDRVWCWGKNDRGQLSGTDATSTSIPVIVRAFSGGAKAIAVGTAHTCVIDGYRDLWCWGSNVSGQLGDGTSSNTSVPTLVPGFDKVGFVSVAAGYAHTCAVDAIGTLWCWGNGSVGQLGTGGGNAISPTRVNGLSIAPKTLVAGLYNTCVTDGGASIQCWGNNSAGQVGNGVSLSSTPSPELSPARVMGLSGNIRGVAAGSLHACAIDGSNVRCWGYGYNYQLGNGAQYNSSSAVNVPL